MFSYAVNEVIYFCLAVQEILSFYNMVGFELYFLIVDIGHTLLQLIINVVEFELNFLIVNIKHALLHLIINMVGF